MYGDWMQEDEKVGTIYQEIRKLLAKMDKTFEKALEFTTYKDKRWE